MTYTPLDLTPWCNAGPEGLAVASDAWPPRGSAPVETGDISMRGLPFRIPEHDMCLVAPDEPMRIEVGQAARHVIVAHRLLEAIESMKGRIAAGR